MSNILIIGITSDIGKSLSKRFTIDSNIVIGTYRNDTYLVDNGEHSIFELDISNDESIDKFISKYNDININWDTLLILPANPLPIESFFKGEFDKWSNSVIFNTVRIFKIIHLLYPYRNKDSNVVLFSAGGVNKSVVNFSAYTASKVFLIKMCEFLDTEEEDMSIFSVGVGWTKTKTHNLILDNVDKDSEKYKETIDFLNSGEGTSMDDIYKCINTLCKLDKSIVSGRNFSIYDTINIKELKYSNDLYKLRRCEK